MDQRTARSTSPGPSAIEWPTVLLAIVIYAGWAVTVAFAERLGLIATHALLTLLACWFMSLQHELLHGHPTRHRRVNRWLGLAPLAVWYPYDLYRDTHLAHHRDEVVTHPGIDPESNYLSIDQYRRLPRWQKGLWVAQRTVVGRLVLGPALVIAPTWLDIVRRPWRGDTGETGSWVLHLGLLALMLWVLDAIAGISPLRYVLGIAYPALGLAMLRSFYEHRPAAEPAHRVVVNEAGWFWRTLYLNNNYHGVHHEQPGLPWYRIRSTYLADRDGCLRRNGGFLVPGYGALWRHYAFTPVDSPVHPPHHSTPSP